MTSHATAYGPLPLLRIEKIGHGAGSRDTPGRPNVLRLIVGEEAAAAGGERVLVLETEVDDMSPQLLGPLLDALLAAGALDAYFTPVQMKKGRPGVLVTRDRAARPARGDRGAAVPRDDDARRAPPGVGADGARRARQVERRDGLRQRAASRSAGAAGGSTMPSPSSRTASAWRPRGGVPVKEVLRRGPRRMARSGRQAS